MSDLQINSAYHNSQNGNVNFDDNHIINNPYSKMVIFKLVLNYKSN